MWRTRVGYAGGVKESPTYYSMGDHTESFQVDYDPSVISYEELLEMFWESHDPSRPAYKTQYASLILAHDDDQLAAARASAARYEARTGRHVATRIDRLGTFWLAEDYHQKYYLRQDRTMMSEFRARFGDDEAALRESTDAARANAQAGGMGSCRL